MRESRESLEHHPSRDEHAVEHHPSHIAHKPSHHAARETVAPVHYARVVYRPSLVPSQPHDLPWRVDVDGNEVSGHATKQDALDALALLPPPTEPPVAPELPGVVKHPLAAAVLLATTPPILEGGPPSDEAFHGGFHPAAKAGREDDDNDAPPHGHAKKRR